jgi:hypothetical protein
MGILILGALCTAGEAFLIYFMVQLFRDSQREQRQLHVGGRRTSAHARQFVRFDVTPPVAKAVWVDGHWRRLDLPISAVSSDEETEAFSFEARRHA